MGRLTYREKGGVVLRCWILEPACLGSYDNSETLLVSWAHCSYMTPLGLSFPMCKMDIYAIGSLGGVNELIYARHLEYLA